MTKKIICCFVVVFCAYANPVGTVLKSSKKAIDEVLVFGTKAYKATVLNGIEKKLLKSARSVDMFGKTFAKRNHIFRPTPENLERMRQGRAPLGIDGKSVELHHVKQEKDGVIVELTHTEHQIKYKNDLHTCRSGMPCTTEVEHGVEWNAIKQKFWRARAKEFDKAS